MDRGKNKGKLKRIAKIWRRIEVNERDTKRRT